MQLVLLADCPREPWRNGGGLTRELLRWPQALDAAPESLAAADDWLLRVSVAEITRDGPFSAFAGVDRWFVVLQGHGVRLGLPAGEQVLRPGDAPQPFAGEEAPGCALIDGPTLDLNLMSRRGGAGSSALRTSMRSATGGSLQRGRLPWRALFAHTPTRLRTDEETHELPAGALWWSDTNLPQTWEVVETGGGAFWMSLQP